LRLGEKEEDHEKKGKKGNFSTGRRKPAIEYFDDDLLNVWGGALD